MPLKVSVGLSQKIGQPHYGSLGASCHVEYEAASTLLQNDLEGFHHQVQAAFVACRQAVQNELSGASGKQGLTEQSRNEAAGSSDQPSVAPPSTNADNGSSQSPTIHSPMNQRSATTSQVRAIRSIADRLQLNLGSWLQRKFGLQSAEELSVGNASRTIDELQELLTRT